MIDVGTEVRIKSSKVDHPWRRQLYSVLGRKGVVASIREVVKSERVPSGLIYEVRFSNGRKEFKKEFLEENLKILSK